MSLEYCLLMFTRIKDRFSYIKIEEGQQLWLCAQFLMALQFYREMKIFMYVNVKINFYDNSLKLNTTLKSQILLVIEL